MDNDNQKNRERPSTFGRIAGGAKFVGLGAGRRPGPPPGPRSGRPPTSTSIRTTEGPNALATDENARDSAFASLGTSVLGVTTAGTGGAAAAWGTRVGTGTST